MGAIEEIGTLLQDIVAPDLKSLTVRMEAVEKQVAALEQRTEVGFNKVDARFTTLASDISARLDKQERDAEKRHNELVSYLSLEARMNEVERALKTSGKHGQ